MSSITSNISFTLTAETAFKSYGCFLNSATTITGPRQKMTDDNIQTVLSAFAYYQKDKKNAEYYNKKFNETGRDVDFAKRFSDAFEKSQSELQKAFSTTGLVIDFN